MVDATDNERETSAQMFHVSVYVCLFSIDRQPALYRAVFSWLVLVPESSYFQIYGTLVTQLTQLISGPQTAEAEQNLVTITEITHNKSFPILQSVIIFCHKQREAPLQA